MSTTRILIVDDEANMRTTLADILADEGYHVSTASSGEQAVELCLKDDFDVVLMDVRMPGMDGVEAFRQVRRHREGVRVILMSAYSADDLKQTALEEGAIAFLPKPLNVENVVRLVSEITDTAILVVENDEGVAEPMREVLREKGYRVSAVASPQEALELVEQIRFDIVFIDVNLPTMNGLELYLAIKRITPASVAIMISGMEGEFEPIAREAVRQTAYTIVRKPLDLDHVLQLLDRLTGQRASNAIRKPPINQ